MKCRLNMYCMAWVLSLSRTELTMMMFFFLLLIRPNLSPWFTWHIMVARRVLKNLGQQYTMAGRIGLTIAFSRIIGTTLAKAESRPILAEDNQVHIASCRLG
jgi:hypothetical protein